MFYNFYLNSPIYLQNIFVSIKGFFIQKTRFNKNFFKYLEEYEKSNPDIVNEKALRHFLINAQKSVFWQKRFESYKINLYAENIIEEIKKLPILTKDEVQENLESIKVNKINDKITKNQTGGTTGKGLVFQQTQTMENKQWAVWWRYRRRHGIQLNTWMGWFGGKLIMDVMSQKPPFWRINYPGKQIMFSQYHLNKNTVKLYYDEIVNKKIKWLHGYPTFLAYFANLIKEKKLPNLAIDYVTIGSENLLTHHIQIIREVFGVEPIQHYGLAEGVANISQLPNDELQIDQDFALLELVPTDFDKNIYRIVGTNYSNDSFPLIRYDTKDLAHVEIQNGRKRIISLDGRIEDYIILPNGNKLGRLANIFKNAVNVNEAQIYQPDINNIIIRIVKKVNYKDTDEASLLKECRDRFGKDINITFQYLSNIEKANSGKLRYVISDVK
ncbi:MAG: hypothetical protein LBE91_21660 [Tannerella sp.]|jgi:phenylacetate-CoA ligase|nr:hypothetical protein [Tannerella sp.]